MEKEGSEMKWLIVLLSDLFRVVFERITNMPIEQRRRYEDVKREIDEDSKNRSHEPFSIDDW